MGQDKEKPETMDPLHFHEIHGQEINLSELSSIASRSKGNGIYSGLVFSHRPIRIGEKVTLKVVHLNENRKGHLWLGFTNKSPSSLTSDELDKSVTYFVKKEGWWMKSVTDDFLVKNEILSLQVVNSNGNCANCTTAGGNKIELNGIEWGTGKIHRDPNFLEHVNPKNEESLWFCAYLRGKIINIQLVDDNETFIPTPSESGTGTGTQSLINRSKFFIQKILKNINYIFWMIFSALTYDAPCHVCEQDNQTKSESESEILTASEENENDTDEICNSGKPCEADEDADKSEIKHPPSVSNADAEEVQNHSVDNLMNDNGDDDDDALDLLLDLMGVETVECTIS